MAVRPVALKNPQPPRPRNRTVPTLRHPSRSPPGLQARPQSAQAGLHQALPAGRHRHRPHQGPPLQGRHAAGAPALRGQGQSRSPGAEGPDRGGRGLRDRLDRRARHPARAGGAGRGGLLQQPDEVAGLHRVRRGQGRRVVRRWTASRSCARSTASSPTPSSTSASRPPTSAATGRSPGKFGMKPARSGRDHRRGGGAQGRPGRA